MIASLSEMVNKSTIYKRHEARNSTHSNGGAHQTHQTHVPIDTSIGETVSKLTRRSTIYKSRDIHHQEMHHDSHAGQRHMQPSMSHHHDSLVETLSHLADESSIFDRNLRRKSFLQG